jgi:hypothetical protein
VRPREHVGELALAARAKGVDDLLLREARGQRSADDAIEDDVHRIAEDLRADHGERDARGAEDGDDRDGRALRTEALGEPAERALEVLRTLDRC